MRNYLERARVVLSGSANRDVSTSDVAKFLLESARDDRLDDRIEVADLRTHLVEALLAIRQKWEQHHYLSRAECIFLAQYAQVGCEELAGDPATSRAESLRCVLEAFLAVRALRVDRGIELDCYYLGKPENRKHFDANEATDRSRCGSESRREPGRRTVCTSRYGHIFKHREHREH